MGVAGLAEKFKEEEELEVVEFSEEELAIRQEWRERIDKLKEDGVELLHWHRTIDECLLAGKRIDLYCYRGAANDNALHLRRVRAKDCSNIIRSCIERESSNYIALGASFKEVRDDNLFSVIHIRTNPKGAWTDKPFNAVGYEEYKFSRSLNDLYEYADKFFHMEKSQVKRYIQIVERWCDVAPNKVYTIKPGMKEYSYSQLVELLPVPDDLLDKFNSSMSIKEIRGFKKQLLETTETVAKGSASDVAAEVGENETEMEQEDTGLFVRRIKNIGTELSGIWKIVNSYHSANPSAALQDIANKIANVCRNLSSAVSEEEETL